MAETSFLNPSFVLLEPGKLAFEDRPVPEIQNGDDVVVRIQQTGICGSDVHWYRHGRIGDRVILDPMVLGHESAGTIVTVGPNVVDKRPGDRVALEVGIPCRGCEPCKRGSYNLCPSMKFAATPPVDGTLARFYRMPADFCYVLPPHVSTAEGALLEPTSVAVHVCRLANIQPGMSSVAVFGAGPIGLLCMSVAKVYGASKVIAVEVNQERLRFATKYAAHHEYEPQENVSPEDDARNLVKKCDMGDGAQVVIEASGADKCVQMGLHALARGGTFVQVGSPKNDVALPLTAVSWKEAVIKGSFRYGLDDYKIALELVSSGKVNVKALISQTRSFFEAEQAFKDAMGGKHIKVMIEGPKDRVEVVRERSKPRT